LGKLLEDAAKDAAFQQNDTSATAIALGNALTALDNQCNAVINKHQKLFTTACEYLKTVKGTVATLQRDLQAFRNWEGKKRGFGLMIDHHVGELKKSSEMPKLQDAWKSFGAYAIHEGAHWPGLARQKEAIADLYKLEGQFQRAKSRCVTMAESLALHLGDQKWQAH
jgi:hypothetical protein